MHDDEHDEPGHGPGPCYTPCTVCGTKHPAEELDDEDCCSDECRSDYEDGEGSRYEERSYGPDYFDHPEFTGEPEFADPGGSSALRASGPGNPRNLPCPTCGVPNRLTPADRARGYQCDACADRDERGGDY